MNSVNLPVFILFFAFIYLTLVYGLLKIAEMQLRENIVSHNRDTNQQIKTP